MSKILIVPDVHGSREWLVAKEKIGEVDFVVFMGDYFDSWENKWPSQGENFKGICEFKRANKDKVRLLLGNHDFSYISGTREGANCSGHQHKRVGEIRGLLNSNLDLIDLAFENDGWVFSHAGFSKTWVVAYLKPCLHRLLDEYPKEALDGKEFASREEYDEFIAKINSTTKLWDEKEFSVDLLNEVWHGLTHFNGDENFSYEFDELLDWHGLCSPTGDEVQQGILWIRPPSLLSEPYWSKQVVGHTEIMDGYFSTDGYYNIRHGENLFVLTDSREHKVRGIFDTKKDLEFEVC